MALAAFKTDPVCKFLTATGTMSCANSLAGNRQPITPVEEGKTTEPEESSSALATAEHTSSESASPSPPEHTLETLLLMTKAARGPPSESRRRPTLMGAPGNYICRKIIDPSVSNKK